MLHKTYHRRQSKVLNNCTISTKYYIHKLQYIRDFGSSSSPIHLENNRGNQFNWFRSLQEIIIKERTRKRHGILASDTQVLTL